MSSREWRRAALDAPRASRGSGTSTPAPSPRPPPPTRPPPTPGGRRLEPLTPGQQVVERQQRGPKDEDPRRANLAAAHRRHPVPGPLAREQQEAVPPRFDPGRRGQQGQADPRGSLQEAG